MLDEQSAMFVRLNLREETPCPLKRVAKKAARRKRAAKRNTNRSRSQAAAVARGTQNGRALQLISFWGRRRRYSAASFSFKLLLFSSRNFFSSGAAPSSRIHCS